MTENSNVRSFCIGFRLVGLRQLELLNIEEALNVHAQPLKTIKYLVESSGGCENASNDLISLFQSRSLLSEVQSLHNGF